MALGRDRREGLWSPLQALALLCTLNPRPTESSSDKHDEVLAALVEHGVEGAAVRVVDHDARPASGLTWATATSGRTSAGA